MFYTVSEKLYILYCSSLLFIKVLSFKHLKEQLVLSDKINQ